MSDKSKKIRDQLFLGKSKHKIMKTLFLMNQRTDDRIVKKYIEHFLLHL
jgi:hypothetical protein